MGHYKSGGGSVTNASPARVIRVGAFGQLDLLPELRISRIPRIAS